ncbi:MAG: lipoate--protein ligase [Prolixibacteraceae bacterium]|nr:lipoate--protein ligase [Prolixibacteraceae bacterium]
MITFCLHQTSTDPYFNLAAEEYFLKNFQENCFMLWRSQPTVVVGKHQNALAEINHDFVHSHNIPVARRLSGGGTVFHDLGNLNFTFIRNVEKIQEVNFKVFTFPIVEALKTMGVEAYTTGRNDLLIDGKKISGNAEHVHRNRVLHHGTLLFNSQLEALKGALKVDLSKFEDKAVQSNRSEVTNIAPYLPQPMDVEDFGNRLFAEISSQIVGSQVYSLTETDLEAIQKLSDEKYRTWDWIFGYSPKYRFKNKFQAPKGEIAISLLVEKGLLVDVEITGTISETSGQQIKEALLGCPHDLQAVESRLVSIHDLLQDEKISPEKFAGKLMK